MMRKVWPAGVWGSWPATLYLQSISRDECWCSAHFLLFLQSRTPTHRMVPPTFRVTFPLSSSNLEASLQTCPKVCFPSDCRAVKLTVKRNGHKGIWIWAELVSNTLIQLLTRDPECACPFWETKDYVATWQSGDRTHPWPLLESLIQYAFAVSHEPER